MVNNIAVIGSSGALGSSFIQQLAVMNPDAIIHAFSRSEPKENTTNTFHHRLDYADEASIEAAASLVSKDFPLTMVIVATGILHEDGLAPEKSLKELSAVKFRRLFEVNTILPALIAKHFLPKLCKEKRVIFAALSARVGSISDNHLGGWYAYRASKAALNQFMKTLAIEAARRYPLLCVSAIHPGTTDTGLSRPFQANVPAERLYSPAQSAARIMRVVLSGGPGDTGRFVNWDGSILPW